jgi:cysteinyl-tRNA synthetase
MINVNDEKMSKSLNNFFTVREVSQEYDLEILRFFIVSGHYRKPISYSRETIHQAEASLQRLYNSKAKLRSLLEKNPSGEIDDATRLKLSSFRSDFEKAMDDDINTADAVTAMFEASKYINTYLDENTTKETVQLTLDTYMAMANVLGILYKKPDEEITDDIKQLLEKRKEARKNKDFKLADELRNQLLDMGIEIEDTRDGVKWKKIN